MSDYNRAIIEEFRANEGRVGGRFEGRSMLLLTTTGARTGRTHTNPLVYLPDDGRTVVFATKGGAPTNPDWYHNLRAHPTVTVELGAEIYEADASELEGAERARLYARQGEISPVFADYERRTSRRIPVIALTPEGLSLTTFALVHGAWHGAWCWERLVPELEARGHRALAIDLSSDDPALGCAAYAETIVGAAADVDDLVVVGHSLSGLTIPLVAAARPVRLLVFLCALVPRPGVSLVDQLREEPEIFVPGFGAGLARDEASRSYWPDAEAAIETLFHDCAPDDAAGAAARLRPQGRPPNIEPCPLRALPEVPCASVLARDDRTIAAAWSRRAARERLGVEAVEIPGGHSPFLSRPAALAEVLSRLVEEPYP